MYVCLHNLSVNMLVKKHTQDIILTCMVFRDEARLKGPCRINVKKCVCHTVYWEMFEVENFREYMNSGDFTENIFANR